MLQIEKLSVAYGAEAVVNGLDWSVGGQDSLVTALLGPSGCGKSTLIRAVAGLERPTAGTIRFDGSDLAEIATHRRDFGVVFQDGQLFPGRTVAANIGYGLRVRGWSRADIAARVGQMLELVRLPGVEKRRVESLSGGQAQRVALARALVNRPNLLLLDEPLGKLDSLTRLAMQTELVRLWQQTGLTAVLVTHDVEEALYLAQRVVIFGPRPARVVAELAVDLPYPRHRGDPRLAELRRDALGHLGLEASW